VKSRTSIVVLGLLLALAAGGLWLAIGGSKSTATGAPALEARSATSSSAALDLAPPGSVPSAATSPERAAIVPDSSSPDPHPHLVSGLTQGKLSGRLLLPDGSPASNVATVLFADTHLEGRKPLAETRTASDGSFSLAGDAAPVLLVAVADGVPPLALSTQVVAGTDTRLPDMTFAVGAHIRGTWKSLGRPVPRGSKLSVFLFQGSGTHLDLDGHVLHESGGDVLERGHDATTDAAGRFRIEGIEPGLYQVTLVPEGLGMRLSQDTLEVRASIDDWDLDFDDARIVLAIELDGIPAEADVELTEGEDRSGSSWTYGGTSSVDVCVPPGTVYGLAVKREGCRTVEMEITAPPPRQTLEQTISLVRQPGLAELVVEIVREDREPVRRAGFALFLEQDDAPRLSLLHRRRADGREPSIVRELSSEDGSFRLVDLPPGRYEVRVEPDSGWDEATGSWCHDPAVVDLPSDGRERTTIVLRAGGRLRVRALDSRGTPLAARVRFVGPSGQAMSVGFRTKSGHGEWSSTGSLNPQTPGGWNLTGDALAPGEYEVRLLKDGRREATRTVRVEPGRTTDVEVVLEEL
jgi:hypothetical protein